MAASASSIASFARLALLGVTLSLGGRLYAADRQSYNLPAGEASTTLRQLSEAAKREILFSADAVRGVRTKPVQGDLTPLEAANRMLDGTGLQAVQEERSGALAVRRLQTASAAPRGTTRSSSTASESATSSAQDAVLRGRVSNEVTGQSLEGAVVQVAGSSIAALTERDGAYTLSGLPAGSTTLRVTYPGLDDMTLAVELVAGAVTTKDFALTSGIYKMESFAVTAVREGNAAAIARQESALTVGNSVSIDAYGNVAKGDLGTFLQRMPGVVGEYGGSAVDAILVRGLSPEFTSVMMDGTRAASANPDSRSQLVSGMPSGAIESVEVIKTPTADMDADSLGGVVNLRTRSAFDRTGRSIVLNASGSYNQTMGKYLDPSGSGTRYYPHVSAQYSDVFQLFGRRLGVVVTGTYQVVGDGLQTVRADFASNWDYKSPSAPRRFLYADQEYHQNKRADLHTKFDYKLSDDSSITFAAGYTRFRNVMEQVRPQHIDNLVIDTAQSTEDYWVFSRARYRMQRDFRYTPSDNWRFQLSGKHKIEKWRITWDLSFNDSYRPLDRMSASARSNNDFSMVYDRRTSKEFPTVVYTGGTPPSVDTFNNLSQIAITGVHETASDKIKSAKLDVTRDFRIFGLATKMKTGFRVRQQDRDRDYDEISGNMPAGDYSKYRDASFTHGWLDGRYPATSMIDTKSLFKDAGISYAPSGLAARPSVQFNYNPNFFPANLSTSAANSLLNDYTTRETIPAVYLQGEFKLTRSLQMTAGIRGEQTRATISSRYDNTRATVAEERYGTFKTIESKYTDWFPNLQFRYEPIKHLTLRANYSTTIGRPRLTDLVGRFSVNEIGQAVSFSNPSLSPQESANYDVSIEYYFKPVGVVSLGGFRKEIKNYVTATSFLITGNEFGLDLSPYVGWTGNTRVNAGDGTVEGVEANYTQQLSFLPGVWKGFGVMANWTVITSAGDYNGVVTSLPFKNYLVGMRPRSGNAGVTYNYGRWDLRLMWNHSSSYIASLDASDPSNSEFIGERGQWDFFARFKVTSNINVFLDVINLMEETRGRYKGIFLESRRNQTNLFPRSISAGVQARF